MTRLFAPLFAALLAGCASLGLETAAGPDRDWHSHANTADFTTREIALDLAVDFQRRVLDGTAELTLQRRNNAARELVLDTRDLDIQSVEAATGNGPWSAAGFTLGARDAILGSALRIAMPAGADRVRIRYATRPEASGLQWVTPEQTAGGSKPFLYTQSQAIHARSWIPLQDSPSVRSSYTARIRTPNDLVAVMSAVNEGARKQPGEFRFEMPQPVPSYLIALGVGDLRFRAVTPRSGIWAERSVAEPAAREFADVEKMMKACEKLYGPYRWGRYDMLVLPPSFPYGGMENPRLTFLTPTAIVGDKSGVALIAHELAHSWSGNLVTNATWRDFWLNEGTTTYLTYRIMDEVFGQRRGDMERVLGQQELALALEQVSRPGDAALAYDQRGRDPDEVFSQVPYERGNLLLYFLEQKFGRQKFDAFLRAWFDEHAFQSRTTEDFIAFTQARLLDAQPGVVTTAQLRAWIFDPAMPADALYATSDVFTTLDGQRAAFLAGTIPARGLKAERWTSHEWQHFLDNMPAGVTAAQLAGLDKAYRLTGTRDAYRAVSWYRVAIRAGYAPVYPAVEDFLLKVGRMRFINPLYRELVKTAEGKALAQRAYARAKPTYHPIAQAGIERILAAPQ